jgi:transcriptional regulator with XRE-family HTH domain
MVDATAMGRVIREARLRKGMSLGQLAAAVGRSSSSVRRWERGEVPPAKGLIDQLAEVLEIDPDTLRDLRPDDASASDGDTPGAEPTGSAAGHQLSSERQSVVVSDEQEGSEAPERADRGFIGDVGAAIRDLTNDWSGWIRGILTTVVLIVMLIILIWALGELGDALRAIWDSFDAGSTP